MFDFRPVNRFLDGSTTKMVWKMCEKDEVEFDLRKVGGFESKLKHGSKKGQD